MTTTINLFFLICALATLFGVTYIQCTSLLDDRPGERIVISLVGVVLYGIFGYLALPPVTP